MKNKCWRGELSLSREKQKVKLNIICSHQHFSIPSLSSLLIKPLFPYLLPTSGFHTTYLHHPLRNPTLLCLSFFSSLSNLTHSPQALLPSTWLRSPNVSLPTLCILWALDSPMWTLISQSSNLFPLFLPHLRNRPRYSPTPETEDSPRPLLLPHPLLLNHQIHNGWLLNSSIPKHLIPLLLSFPLGNPYSFLRQLKGFFFF